MRHLEGLELTLSKGCICRFCEFFFLFLRECVILAEASLTSCSLQTSNVAEARECVTFRIARIRSS